MRYSDALIDHFRNPRNAGTMRQPDAVGEAEDVECHDVARFHLRIRDGRVVEARFQAYGCGPTIAAGSAGTEVVTGLEVAALPEVTAARIEAVLGGLPEDRRHAAQVVSAAIRAAWEHARGGAEASEREGRHA